MPSEIPLKLLVNGVVLNFIGIRLTSRTRAGESEATGLTGTLFGTSESEVQPVRLNNIRVIIAS